MNGARERILARIRSARRPSLAGQAGPEAAPGEPEPNRRDINQDDPRYLSKELIEPFAQKWQGIGGVWHHASDPLNLEEILKNILAKADPEGVTAAPSAFNSAPELGEFLQTLGLKIVPPRLPEAAAASVGITGAFLAVAYSGSLVLVDREPGELTASLLPPVHLVLLPGNRLVFSLNQAVERLGREPRPGRAVFISGPSRTADIELTLVLGVHGPREVHAILLDYDLGS